MGARYQHGSVQLDPRTNTWYYRWRENGRRRAERIGTLREYPTKAAAMKAAERSMVRINTEVSTPSPVATVCAVAQRYQDERMPQRFATRRTYLYNLNNWILPKWGDLPISEVKPYAVELWLKTLGLSGKSKQALKSRIAILIDCAMLWELMPVTRNPMELFSIRGATKRTKPPRILSEAEFHALRGALDKDPWRTWLLLGICLGGRFSEIIGLKWSDIDWFGKKLSISRSLVFQRVAETKTEESAEPIPLNDDLIRLLTSWRSQTEFKGENDWVFASPYSAGTNPYSYYTLWKKLGDASKRCGIGHVTSHALRHTYRTWLDAEGTPVGVIQKLMRHADVRTTMNIYGGAIPDSMRQAQGKVVEIAMRKAVRL